VKDPIGITGWPKEKGRDGERTPMQWTPGPQAGFSTDSHTWLPIPPSYKTVNVQTESAEPDSLLNWYKEVIALRRMNPALHDGGIVMLDEDSKDILAYVRTAPKGDAPVIVAMNMSAQAQTVSVDLSQAGVSGHSIHTLAASDASLGSASSSSVTLPPFSSWIASIQ
jgi:alpha-glucosidase